MIEVPGYTIIRKLGEGGCAEIYRADEHSTGRKVAIKVLHARHLNNSDEFKRLSNEGSVGLQLGPHQNVVKTYHAGKVNNCPYVVLEYLPAKTLRELLIERKMFKNRTILQIAQGIGQALNFLHKAGVYHKDVKPDNIMMDGKGLMKLIDMGFAETKLKLMLSFFGRSLDGSPNYMAPELITSKKPSEGSDIYALGCALYECATGKTPFRGKDDQETLQNQLNKTLKAAPILPVNSGVTFATQKLILGCIEKNPEMRHKSAEAFLMEVNRNPDTQESLIYAPARSSPSARHNVVR